MAAYTNIHVTTLQAEITNDPLSRGYSGMTDQQKVDSLNTEDRVDTRVLVSSGEIMETINGAEFAALNNAETARVDRVLGLGAEVIVGPGNAHNAVQELLATFGGGSATVAALVALRDTQISRAKELGIPPANISAIGRLS